MPKRRTLEMCIDELSRINSNIRIIDEKYVSSRIHLKCECLICGHMWGAVWGHLSNGKGCPICAGNVKLNIGDIIKYMKNINENIIVLEDKYINARTKMKCKCNICNNIWNVSWNKLQQNRGCPNCARLNQFGENSPVYNPNLSDEDRECGRNVLSDSGNLNTIWRKNIYDKYKYTCCITGKNGHLNAHHLNSYHWDKENRHNIENGVCILKSIHKLFHKIYGNKNNTKEQFYEFKDRYDSGEFGFDFK